MKKTILLLIALILFSFSADADRVVIRRAEGFMSAISVGGGPPAAAGGDYYATNGWGRQVALTIESSACTTGTTTDDAIVLITQDTLPTEAVDSDEANRILSSGCGECRFHNKEDPTTESDGRLNIRVVNSTLNSNPASADFDIFVSLGAAQSCTADSTIYFFYNKSGQSQPLANATGGSDGVYDSDFHAVYHFEEASGTVYDASSNNNDSTTENAVTYAQTGQVGSALSFNGTSTYLEFPAEQGNRITVLAWVYCDTLSVSHGVVAHAETYDDATHDRDLVIGTDGDLYFYAWDGAEVNFFTDTNGPVSATTWTQVGYIYDGTNYKLIADGAFVATEAGNAPYASYSTPEFIVGFSDYTSNSNFEFDGLIDEVWYSKSARPESWIEAEYNFLNAPATHVTEGTPSAP